MEGRKAAAEAVWGLILGVDVGAGGGQSVEYIYAEIHTRKHVIHTPIYVYYFNGHTQANTQRRTYAQFVCDLYICKFICMYMHLYIREK